MLEGLSWQAIGITGSGWALAFMFGVLLFRGRVYVASQVDREFATAAAALERAEHDRDEWRAESRIRDTELAEKNKQIAEKDRQLEHMGEVGRTMKAVLTALQRMAAGEVDR